MVHGRYNSSMDYDALGKGLSSNGCSVVHETVFDRDYMKQDPKETYVTWGINH